MINNLPGGNKGLAAISSDSPNANPESALQRELLRNQAENREMTKSQERLDRAPGVPIPGLTGGAHPNQRRYMSDGLFGFGPTFRGDGSGNYYGGVTAYLDDTEFPVPGTPILEHRASPTAAGNTYVQLSTPTDAVRASVNVVSGCGETEVIVTNRYLYFIEPIDFEAEPEENQNPSTWPQVYMKPTDVPTYIATVASGLFTTGAKALISRVPAFGIEPEIFPG